MTLREMWALSPCLVLSFALVGSGCGVGYQAPDGSPSDGSPPEADGGPTTDSGTNVDAGTTPPPDAGPVDSGTDAGSELCAPPPTCDVTPPVYDPLENWRHRFATPITVSMGSERHRGRDLLLRETDEQWALAKFAYGPFDDDLKDEDVDIYLLRDCSAWEYLGRATTTDNPPHATVERIVDDGGRLYFRIPDAQRLGPGRHRIHFVVRGDHTTADQYIHVLRPGERLAVSDVDGTLTESETAEFITVLNGPSPQVNPNAPEALWALANRGYIIFYVTARPDWLTTRTHEWRVERGLPPGLVHTTNNGIGALGGAAVTFKTEELGEIADRLGRPVDIAIGNKDSDAEAYLNTGVAAEYRFFYQITTDPMGGVRFENYSELIPIFEALPAMCF